MRAIVLDRYGGREVLAWRDLPDPVPGPGEVLVRVAAAGINRADVMQRMGQYPPPGPKPEHEIPGLEFAGTVETAGGPWKPGDRVFGLLTGGGYADRVAVDARMCMPIPGGMDFATAAAIPEIYFTAWDALDHKGGFRAGETVLVHAAASGVGTAAVQLARLLGAGRIFATTRSAEKAARLAGVGADRAIVTGSEDFAKVVLAETGDRGADVVLDFLGAPAMEPNLRCAALEGRIVLIAYLGGGKAELPIPLLQAKRLRIWGTSLRSRSLERKIAITERFVAELLPHFASGRIAPVMDRTFRPDGIGEAHRLLEENRSFGKFVLAF